MRRQCKHCIERGNSIRRGRGREKKEMVHIAGMYALKE